MRELKRVRNYLLIFSIFFTGLTILGLFLGEDLSRMRLGDYLIFSMIGSLLTTILSWKSLTRKIGVISTRCIYLVLINLAYAVNLFIYEGTVIAREMILFGCASVLLFVLIHLVIYLIDNHDSKQLNRQLKKRRNMKM